MFGAKYGRRRRAKEFTRSDATNESPNLTPFTTVPKREPFAQYRDRGTYCNVNCRGIAPRAAGYSQPGHAFAGI